MDSVKAIETMKALLYSIEGTKNMFLKWDFLNRAIFMLLIAKGGLYEVLVNYTILEKKILYYTIPIPILFQYFWG